MQTYQINILNPKAEKLLQDLADLNLISIRQTAGYNFLNVIDRLRSKATGKPPSLNEITKEVEAIRTKRYGRNKG